MNIFMLGLLLPIVIVTIIFIDMMGGEKFISYFNKHKENIYITSSILIIILILLLIRLIFGELNGDFWLLMIPNLITDLLGIVFATYIINILLRKKNEKDIKEKSYKMIGKHYEGVISEISKLYITALTREPVISKKDLPNVSELLNQTKTITNDINLYIDEEYFKKGIDILYFNEKKETSNVFDKFEDLHIDRVTFTEIFKVETNQKLENFITKYISVLPEELRELLFLLEENMRQSCFLNPRKLNRYVDITTVKFNVDDFREQYKMLGENLINLLSYFENIKK